MRTELILRGLPSILIENISLFIWLFYKYFVLLYVLKRKRERTKAKAKIVLSNFYYRLEKVLYPQTETKRNK